MIISLDRKNEIVEIKNNSARDVDISGWTLLDSNLFRHPFPKYRHRFIFPEGTIIPARDTIRVHTFWGINTARNIYQKRRAPMWNNPQDVAILLDRTGNPAGIYPEDVLRTISGRVYKAGTETGIVGANVTARLASNPNTLGIPDETENDGSYSISDLGPWKYEVVASKDRYVTSEPVVVDLTNGDAENVNFYLVPSSREINISVEETEFIPEQPEWNRTHEIKVTFKNNSEDVYHFETNLYRQLRTSDSWSGVPGASQSSDGVFGENQTKEVTFAVPKEEWMDWDWFSLGFLGFASEVEISRKILYKVWFKAVREEDEPAFEDKKEFDITVRVPQERRAALVRYNYYLGVKEAELAAATILSAAAATALLGWITAPLAVGFLIGAAAAYYSSCRAGDEAAAQLRIMDDR